MHSIKKKKMSSKKSLNSSNTLFNYFSKSPATPKTNGTSGSVKSGESPLSSKKPTPTSKKSLSFGECNLIVHLFLINNCSFYARIGKDK